MPIFFAAARRTPGVIFAMITAGMAARRRTSASSEAWPCRDIFSSSVFTSLRDGLRIARSRRSSGMGLHDRARHSSSVNLGAWGSHSSSASSASPSNDALAPSSSPIGIVRSERGARWRAEHLLEVLHRGPEAGAPRFEPTRRTRSAGSLRVFVAASFFSDSTLVVRTQGTYPGNHGRRHRRAKS